MSCDVGDVVFVEAVMMRFIDVVIATFVPHCVLMHPAILVPVVAVVLCRHELGSFSLLDVLFSWVVLHGTGSSGTLRF